MRITIWSFLTTHPARHLAALAPAALLLGLVAAPPALQAQASAATATNNAGSAASAPAQAAATPSRPEKKKKKKHHFKLFNAQRIEPATVTAKGQPSGAEAKAAKKNKPHEAHVKVAKADRIQETKGTKVELKKEAKYNPLIGKDSQLPDKQLYDKAMAQIASGHYDIGRLDMQALLDTYPDSQYMMRAKLAIADAWYKEGGSAAYTEAAQEYRDFITFFPNVPEASEAQLRIGDIDFKQMNVPGRDYSKAEQAEQEYRTMLTQYPDAPKPILDEARQKLREVQEILAEREAQIGDFYASESNWPAAIARYETVVETYPLYSHMDDVLIGIGDAYEAEASAVRAQPTCAANMAKGTRCMPEAVKGRLLQDYDGKAAQSYRAVVLYHAAAPHAEQAKERLTGMNLPIPTPTKEEVELSDELENSRAPYSLQKRIEVLFLQSPNTVTTARIGLPPLQDPPPVLAPTIVKELMTDYRDAYNPNLAKAHPELKDSEVYTKSSETAAASAPAPATSAPPTLESIPTEGSAAAMENDKTVTVVEPVKNSSGGSGTGLGVDVITPGSGGGSSATGTPASNLPSATGAQDPNYGLPMPKPAAKALPPVEKPTEAPDQVNDVEGQATPLAEPTPASTEAAANGKKTKKNKNKKKAQKIDKNDESSSRKKPKHGLDKLNPF